MYIRQTQGGQDTGRSLQSHRLQLLLEHGTPNLLPLGKRCHAIRMADMFPVNDSAVLIFMSRITNVQLLLDLWRIDNLVVLGQRHEDMDMRRDIFQPKFRVVP